MARGKKDKPTRKERRAQKKHILLGDDGEDLDTQLKVLGLTTKCITGDGNCLFRALSDQYYGYDKHHKAIRQEVCQYLGQNKDTYQYFVEDDIPFDRYLENMRQDGCFGGHMIIVGFAKLRQVDVKIYQPGMIYVIHGVDEDEENSDEESSRQVLHIAYHSWEHYSSVRNIDGPYNGMPEIKDNNEISPAANEDNGDESGENLDDDADSSDSKEKMILTSCPNTNIRKIRRLLRKYKGNPNKVIDALYEQEQEQERKQEYGQQHNEQEENTNQDPTTSPTTALTATTATIAIAADGMEDTILESNSDTQTQPNKEESTAIAEAPSEKELDQSKKGNDNDNTKGTTTPKTTQLASASSATSTGPPKRLTAQQRKQQAKMRQKEQKREKKQQAANKHVVAAKKATETDNNVNTMKQLYI